MSRLLPPVAALALALTATAPAHAAPPPNDNYLASIRINNADGAISSPFKQSVDTAEATTQADLFDPNKDGVAFGGSKPEPTGCAAAPSYGKTVWWDFVPPTPGAVRIFTSGFDTAFAVYEWDLKTSQLGKQVACQNGSAGTTEERLIERPLRRGRNYTIQVGGVNGAGGPLDFSFEFFADRDADEVLDAQDKCPALAGIFAFGGCPPDVHGSPQVTVVGTGSGVRVVKLAVVRADRRQRVEVRCNRCGKRVRARAPRGGTIRVRRFEGRTLSAGDRLEVRVTQPRSRSGRFKFGAIGKVTSFPITRDGLGAPRRRCTRPGSAKPIKCP
jgi:hypothetical protein